MLGEQSAVEPGPLGQVTLLVVVRDQRDPAPYLLVRMDTHGSQAAAGQFPARERYVACTFRLGQRSALRWGCPQTARAGQPMLPDHPGWSHDRERRHLA